MWPSRHLYTHTHTHTGFIKTEDTQGGKKKDACNFYPEPAEAATRDNLEHSWSWGLWTKHRCYICSTAIMGDNVGYGIKITLQLLVTPRGTKGKRTWSKWCCHDAHREGHVCVCVCGRAKKGVVSENKPSFVQHCWTFPTSSSFWVWHTWDCPKVFSTPRVTPVAPRLKSNDGARTSSSLDNEANSRCSVDHN